MAEDHIIKSFRAWAWTPIVSLVLRRPEFSTSERRVIAAVVPNEVRDPLMTIFRGRCWNIVTSIDRVARRALFARIDVTAIRDTKRDRERERESARGM